LGGVTRRVALALSAGVVALATPASAQVAQKPADVTRIEAAVVELAKLERGRLSGVTRAVL
jgi:hypothetical protein